MCRPEDVSTDWERLGRQNPAGTIDHGRGMRSFWVSTPPYTHMLVWVMLKSPFTRSLGLRAPPAGTVRQDTQGVWQGSYQVTSDSTGWCISRRGNEAVRSMTDPANRGESLSL